MKQGFSVVLVLLELALVGQVGLKLIDPPASASRILRLKACATTSLLRMTFLKGEKFFDCILQT